MKKKILNVSLAIVTKNRNKELARCLLSIVKQNQLPEKLIIIDNDPNQSAQSLTKHPAFSILSILYLSSDKTVPDCRNLAIKKTKSRYLGFIDDDCVLCKDWLSIAVKHISNSGKDYLLGNTLLLNQRSIFALAQHTRDTYWRRYNIYNSRVKSGEIFDTKNVILDLKKIKTLNLQFDPKCQFGPYDSADFDFGYQINKANLEGEFCSAMKLYHEETSNLNRFVKRAYARGKNAKHISEKWKLKHKLINKKDNYLVLWFLRTIKHFATDFYRYKLLLRGSFFKKVATVLFIKIFERYYALGYMQC